MKYLLAFLTLTSCALAGTWMASPGKGSHASGVVGAWYDNGTFAATDRDSDVAHQTSWGAIGAALVPTSSGTCTKVRVYFGTVPANGTCKGALYTSTGTLLSQGSVAVSTTTPDQWYEITLAVPQAVTASTTYIVGYMVDTSGTAQGREQVGQPSGSGKVNFTEVYASFSSGSVTWGNHTAKYLIGMWVQ